MKIGFAVLVAFIELTSFAAEPPAAPQLNAFAGELEGTLEQQVKKGEWSSSSVSLSGRPIVAGRYVELRGTFRFAGFARPIEIVFLWSYDPFQNEYRLAVLDDYSGLLDVFEQESSSPLTLSNVRPGTFFQDAKGRRSYNQVTVHFAGDGALRMQWAGSTDEGKTWREYARVTLRRSGK